MDIAKFVLTAVGTFLSVFTLSFGVFQYWKKKQDEKFDLLKSTIEKLVNNESSSRNNSCNRLEKRIERLEHSVILSFEKRLSTMEGELGGIKRILGSIENWFVQNTPKGGL